MYLIIVGILFSFLMNQSLAQATPPKVVATIKPIHSLVCGVMKGVAQPDLLLKGQQSVHTYQMTPADQKLLQKAELIIWVGPTLESFLEKAFKNKKNTLKLIDSKHIKLLPIRHFNGTKGCNHDHHHDKHHSHEGYIDGHIWLSLENAKGIVLSIKERLIELDPEHKDIYTQNAERLIKKIDNFLIHKSLTNKGTYVMFHDGLQYFDHSFHTKAAGVLTLSPETGVTLSSMKNLHDMVKTKNVRCILGETQFPIPFLKNFAKQNNLKYVTVDYMGTSYQEGEDAYFELMEDLFKKLFECLN